MNQRSNLLDHWRALAIILMIFFHFFFDLNLFGYVHIDFQEDTFWWFLPRLIVFLFMTAVGVSLGIVHSKKMKWKSFWVRFFKVGFFALVISIVTYLTFPKAWIYFGTLHCIAISSVLAIPFLNRPKLSLLTSLAIIIPGLFGVSLPWIKLSHQSMDYIPPFPWVGYILLGIWIYHKKFHLIKSPISICSKQLSFMSKHSLKIYVLHQPIMYSFIYLFYLITHSN